MREEGDTIDNRYPGKASQPLTTFYVLTVQRAHGDSFILLLFTPGVRKLIL